VSRLFSLKLWFSCLIVIALIVAFALYQVKQLTYKQITPSTDSLLVKKGSSLGGIANLLEKRGVIENALHLKLVAKQAGNANQLKAGEYDISEPQSIGELWKKLVSHDVIAYKVRFLEGWDFKTVLAHLKSVEDIKHVVTGLSHKQIMQRLGAKNTHPEGQFAPNTFFYQKGATDLSILKQSFNLQQQVVEKEWENRKPSKYIKSKYDALILASIIEKETGVASETDPTVIYGMGEQYRGNIKRIHLRTDTPYNTYTRYGLPPTPIAMPSEAAINAAVNPKKTSAFYFVGKGNGSHYFSATYAEHNRAVSKYQLGK